MAPRAVKAPASRRPAARSSTRTAPSAMAAMPWAARPAPTLRNRSSFSPTPPAKRSPPSFAKDGPTTRCPASISRAQEIRSVIAFIHAREAQAKTHPGGRRGVSPEDLQTGNAQAGKKYFEGAGGCTKCHSATGDLAGVANRYQGLQLEEHMLYPRDAKSTVTVTLPVGREGHGHARVSAMSSPLPCATAMAFIARGPPVASSSRWTPRPMRT